MFKSVILIFLTACITGSRGLICSQCGGVTGLPLCIPGGPLPTACPSGSVYCLNNTMTLNGLPVSVVRSCSATILTGYTANSCFTASASSLLNTKCACSSNGCNMDPAQTNMSITAFLASFANFSMPPMPGFNLSIMPSIAQWSNVTTNFNLTGVAAQFSSLLPLNQYQMLQQMTSGNLSTNNMTLGGIPLPQLMNNTAGFLPIMLSGVSSLLPSNITSIMNAYMPVLNASGGIMPNVNNMLGSFVNVLTAGIFPSNAGGVSIQSGNVTKNSGETAHFSTNMFFLLPIVTFSGIILF